MADTYDLDLVQNETFERAFRWREGDEVQSFDGYDIKSQLRKKENIGSTLLLDLAQYITVESSGLPGGPEETDPPVPNDRLRLRIPANVTSELNPRDFSRGTCAWDVFAINSTDPTDGALIVEGAANLNPASTDTVA